MLPSFVTRRRYAARYRRITTVLISHGFGGLLAPLDLQLRSRLFPWTKSNGAADVGSDTGHRRGSMTRAEHLRLAFEELGPAFIKLGQILSTRSDILPPEYVAELVKLQDRVPPTPFEEISSLVEIELGRPIAELFLQFDPVPLATASIGQVHTALLADGKPVAVKVQRPGVAEIVDQDLAIMTDLALLAARRLRFARHYDIPGLVAEFTWTLRSELDYVREGRNAERMARVFADDPNIHVPTIHWPYSTAHVLTMERLRGIRIDDLSALEAMGYAGGEIAERAAMLFLREVLDEGFFHADPHPGNFIVMDGGVIGAMDFGMVGTIDERLRERLLLLLIAVVDGDTARIADDVVAIGASGPELVRASLERDIGHMLAQYYGRPLSDIRVTRLIAEVMAVIQRNHLRLPAELALLAKTIAMSEALGRHLDPAFNVARISEPFVQQALRRLYSPSYWRAKLRLRPLETALLGVSLPGHAQRLLNRLERNELTFHVHYDELDQTLSGLNSMVNRLALAVLTAASGICLAIMYQAITPAFISWSGALFVLGFLGCLMIGFFLLVSIWRSGR